MATRKKFSTRATVLGSYTVELDGEWLMNEFSDFFHFYAQVYSVCVFILPEADSGSLEQIVARYPWRGGYSVVNFYTELDRYIGVRGRPRVKSINYASPGAMELAVVVLAATNVRKIVKQFVKSAEMLNDLYSKIRKGMIERKMLSLDVRERKLQLSERELAFAREAYLQLSTAMELPGGQRLLDSSPNSVMALKILLSLYRRVRNLATFEIKGKASL